MPICPQCLKENPELGAKCPRCADSYYVYDEAAEEGERDPYIGHKAADKYVIIARISEGGMGTVYRALQLPVEREVAFKVLRAELEDNDEVRDRFTREARAVSKINHPNIITLHDFGFDESDYPYMVMEYAPGQNLDDWIYEDWVSLERIIHVIRQILSALADAHEQGVVHRDLKPENIMVTGTGTDQDFIKLLDFGIARLVNEQATEGLTREGEVFGTPHYMSPEQAEGETGIGPPADVYAIGIMLYEMLCRECPFDAPKPLSILFKQINEDLPELNPRRGVTVPAALENLMRKATAKDPEERFATAGEMLAELDKLDNPDRSGIVQAAQNGGTGGGQQTTQRGIGESQPTPQPESQADGPANPATGAQPSPNTSPPADQSSEQRDKVATANTLGFDEEEHGARPQDDSRTGMETPPSENDVSVDEPADELFALEEEQDEEDNSTILAVIGVLTFLVIAGFTTLTLMGDEPNSETASDGAKQGETNTAVAAGETPAEQDAGTTGGLALGEEPDAGSSDNEDESAVASDSPDGGRASDEEATGRAARSDEEGSGEDESGSSAADTPTETAAGTESTGTRTGGTESAGGGREASSDDESDDSESGFDLEPDKLGDDSSMASDDPDPEPDPEPVSESESTEEAPEPQKWGPGGTASDSSESSDSESDDDSELEKFGSPDQQADDESDKPDDGPSKFGAPGE